MCNHFCMFQLVPIIVILLFNLRAKSAFISINADNHYQVRQLDHLYSIRKILSLARIWTSDQSNTLPTELSWLDRFGPVCHIFWKSIFIDFKFLLIFIRFLFQYSRFKPFHHFDKIVFDKITHLLWKEEKTFLFYKETTVCHSPWENTPT